MAWTLEKRRAHRMKLAAKGICNRCDSRKAMPGARRCRHCWEADQRVKKERKDDGRCTHCGHEKDDPDKTICSSCHESDIRSQVLRRMK